MPGKKLSMQAPVYRLGCVALRYWMELILTVHLPLPVHVYVPSSLGAVGSQ